MTHEQLAGRIQALDAQLTAHDADEALVLHAILGEKIRRTGLQRVHGKEFVAVCREHQHGRAILPLAQQPQEAEAFVRRHGVTEQHQVDAGEIESLWESVLPSSADARR